MESKSSARLAWDIKRYDVLTPKKERKRVLHATSHAVYGGELFLILGPSGSGKTSLSLTYTGRLRLPTVGAKGVRATVARVLNDLDLGRCGDTYVGDERLKGISGGEEAAADRRGLVSDPNTLVLDEPTSGLDAATALLTVRSVSRIANDGAKAVVAVVHQPRAALMLLFDMALVLSEGRPAYSGHPGDELLRHFSTLGLEPPAHDNPADFVMDLVAVPDEIFETDAESVAALDLRKRDRTRVLDAYGASRGAADAARRYGAAAAAAAEKRERREPAPSSWLYQFDVLARRAFTYKFRDEMVVVTQVTRVGAVSFSMLLMSFIAFDVVLLFPKERDLYKREHAAGLYCPSAFFHARCVAELPGHLVAGGCYATVTYWMMGFQQDLGKFLSYVALCEALVLSGTSLLIACGCLAKDFEGANNIATVAYCLFMMFDGHYINNKSIPEGARWIKQLNFFNWGISARGAKCVFQRGDDAADYYGYHQTVREALAALALICVVMRFLGFLAFKYFFQDHPLFAPKPIPDDLPPEPAPEPAAPAPEDGPGTRGAGRSRRASSGATPGGFTEQVLERKDGAHNQYGLSEWLVVVAVGAAWTATAYAYLSSRVKLV
ncbi:ATPase [Aureococcus anophagefferens]|nr:ATPase [Aureococcus anophagefferens]